MPKPIVVALDPDHGDDAPLIVGTALARMTSAPLTVVGAYVHDPITNAVSAGTVDADLRTEVLSALESRTTGSDAEVLVMGGPSAARVLHEAAVKLGASLLVVGLLRYTGKRHAVRASQGERLRDGR